MAIPSMLEIIQRFNACSPAQEWAGDMDVQEGWDDCKEPGWLMLLAFSTQKYPNAVGFKRAAACTYACIEPAMSSLQDPQLRMILEHARAFGQNPVEEEKETLKIHKAYATGWLSTASDVFRVRGKIKPGEASEYMACCAVNQLVFAMLRSQDVLICGKLANAAIDSSVTATVAMAYPDLLDTTFQLPEITPVSVIKQAEAARKIEVCQILRRIIPGPFTKFE